MDFFIEDEKRGAVIVAEKISVHFNRSLSLSLSCVNERRWCACREVHCAPINNKNILGYPLSGSAAGKAKHNGNDDNELTTMTQTHW